VQLEGQFRVKADRPDVYRFLTDPATVSKHLPDVKEVEIEDEDHFTVKAAVGVSHIRGTMVMRLAITERQPPISVTVTGRGSGLASVVDMVTSFSLASSPSGDTVVHWHGSLNVAGKLAAFGAQGLLDRMARKNVDAFIDGL
jgi:2-furoyl-CoA dehydrogenase large subunit